MGRVVIGLQYSGLSSKRQQARQHHCRLVAASLIAASLALKSRIVRQTACGLLGGAGVKGSTGQGLPACAMHSALHGQIRLLSAEVP